MNYQGQRIAIIDGIRTPFAKQASELKSLSAVDLGAFAIKSLMNRYNIQSNNIDMVVFGQVIPRSEAPNIAREVALIAGLGSHVDAFSVIRACATSQQAFVSAAQNILLGNGCSAIVGGADSASNIPFCWGTSIGRSAIDFYKAKLCLDKVKVIRQANLKQLIPFPPSISEFSTGFSMGQTAEQMAKTFAISRYDQDAFAHRSHTLAAKAWKNGKLEKQVATVYPKPYCSYLDHDNVLRDHSDLADYSKLRPIFDKRFGTVTAGNSTALTDGGGAIFIMREDRAKSQGLPILGYLRAYHFCSIDVKQNMLLGPAYAIPRALSSAGMSFNNIDVIEMHEAFSSQVLANLHCLSSTKFARECLHVDQPVVGDIDISKINHQGGSLAYGHPFAATGARLITQTLYQLKHRGGGIGLVSSCAAGGIGSAMILEAENE